MEKGAGAKSPGEGAVARYEMRLDKEEQGVGGQPDRIMDSISQTIRGKA